MSGHYLITLRLEDSTQLVGTANLVEYPAVGDVILDRDATHWLVTGREWLHNGGLTLRVRRASQ